MATKVLFDPKGPALEADVRIGFAQAGAYVLKLFDGNEVVQRWEGTFFNPDDDRYALPGTAKENNGRLLQCRFGVEIIPPEDQYALMLTIMQGTQKLAVITVAGQTSEPEVTRSLFAELMAQ